jgi:hypothetical protein
MAGFRHALIVLLGYAVAVVATPFLVLLAQNVISVLPGGPSASNPDGILGYVMTGAMVTGMYAALPFLGAIALMRWWRRRDWPSHAVFGVLVAYAAMALFTEPFAPASQHFPFLIAGAGAGIVYWFCRRQFGWSWA